MIQLIFSILEEVRTVHLRLLVQNYCPVTGKSIKNKRCLKSYSLEDHNLSELSFRVAILLQIEVCFNHSLYPFDCGSKGGANTGGRL